MQQTSTHRATTHLTVVPDPLGPALFHASRIGAELAAERREYEEFISMKLHELRRIWKPVTTLRALGMPKLSSYEIDLLDVLIYRGRLYEGHLIWMVMRPKQRSLAISLAFEMETQRPHASAALTRLIKVGLLASLTLGDRPAVWLTDLFHEMMFEAQWRYELRNSAPEITQAVIKIKGWEWLLDTVDELFRHHKLDPGKVDDRRRVLKEVQRRCKTR